jgi:hypothetical protein
MKKNNKNKKPVTINCELGETAVKGLIKVDKWSSVLSLTFYQDTDTTFDITLNFSNVGKQELIDFAENILDLAGQLPDDD